MSNITSRTYPVQTNSKANDQFTIVRNGQLMKLTRSGLDALIKSLAPETVLELTDTPASYIGQQGKVLVVNPGENGMVFEAATAGNFLALSDTPESYGGKAGNIPLVNAGETALEFIANALIALSDTPSAYAGASKRVLRVNTGETAVEFVTPNDAAPDTNLTGGFADYNNGAGTQAYVVADGFLKVTNNGAGPATNEEYLPTGVTTIYDGANSQFDFSQLPDGSIVTIRATLRATTTATNQIIQTRLSAAIGGSTPYTIGVAQKTVRTAGLATLDAITLIYIVDDNTRNFPAQIEFSSTEDAIISAVGYVISVNIRGA